VLDAADGIGRETEKIRSEVTGFLAALRDSSDERRRYEPVSANLASAVVRVPGQPPIHAAVKEQKTKEHNCQWRRQLKTGWEQPVNLDRWMGR